MAFNELLNGIYPPPTVIATELRGELTLLRVVLDEKALAAIRQILREELEKAK